MVIAPPILIAKFRFRGRGKGFYCNCLTSNCCCAIEGMVYGSLVKGINDVDVVFVSVGGAITTIARSHVHMLFLLFPCSSSLPLKVDFRLNSMQLWKQVARKVKGVQTSSQELLSIFVKLDDESFHTCESSSDNNVIVSFKIVVITTTIIKRRRMMMFVVVAIAISGGIFLLYNGLQKKPSQIL